MTERASDIVTVLSPGGTKSWGQEEAGSVQVRNDHAHEGSYRYRLGSSGAWSESQIEPRSTEWIPKPHDAKLTLRNTGPVPLTVSTPW